MSMSNHPTSVELYEMVDNINRNNTDQHPHGEIYTKIENSSNPSYVCTNDKTVVKSEDHVKVLASSPIVCRKRITLCACLSVVRLVFAVIAISVVFVFLHSNQQQQIQMLQSQLQNSSQRVQILEQTITGLIEHAPATTQQINTTTDAIDVETMPTIQMPMLGSFEHPAISCGDFSRDSPSKKYWVQNTTGNPVLVYCDTDHDGCSCNCGTWMRVANVDMTNQTQQCPTNLRELTRDTAPLRTCGRPFSLSDADYCASTTFRTYGIQYSRVCGQVIGYQFGRTAAFDTQFTTIDEPYLHGISFTDSPGNTYGLLLVLMTKRIQIQTSCAPASGLMIVIFYRSHRSLMVTTFVLLAVEV